MLRELFDDWDNDASWTELSQHFIANEHREKQTQPTQNKLHTSSTSSTSSPGCLLVRLLPFKAVQSSSCQSELYHVHRFVTGGTFVTMSPLQNSLFMPQHNVSG